MNSSEESESPTREETIDAVAKAQAAQRAYYLRKKRQEQIKSTDTKGGE